MIIHNQHTFLANTWCTDWAQYLLANLRCHNMFVNEGARAFPAGTDRPSCLLSTTTPRIDLCLLTRTPQRAIRFSSSPPSQAVLHRRFSSLDGLSPFRLLLFHAHLTKSYTASSKRSKNLKTTWSHQLASELSK